MPNLRLKQRVLDVQKAFRRRSSTSAHQALAFEERAPSPLAASSESSNAAEKTSQMSSSEQICNDHKEESASNPLTENTAAAALQKETLTTRTRSASSRNSSLGSTARSPTSPSSPSQPTTSLPLPCEEPLASTKLEDRPRSLKSAAEIPGSDPPIGPPPPAIIPAPASGKTSSTASLPPNPAIAQQPPSTGSLKPELPDLPSHSPPAPPRIQTYPLHRPLQDRKQSLLPASDSALIRTLLGSGPDSNTATSPTFGANSPLLEESPPTFRSVPVEFQLPTPATLGSGMLNGGRVWVRRPGGSPTIVNVRQEDMVDDVRDVVLKKYQNALGKSYDAPDISIRVIPRHSRPRSLDHTPGRGYDSQPGERMLNPDETIVQVLDDYFPGGQSIDEALVIEVPQPSPVGRRTPRPSPHHVSGSHHDSHSNMESDNYFPPMPHTSYQQAPPTSSSQISLREPSTSVLNTGQVPNLPGSPGGANRRNVRPGNRRIPTSSPVVRSSASEMSSMASGVILRPPQNRSRANSDASNTAQPAQAPPITTPTTADNTQKASTPPARIASPLAKKLGEKKQHSSPAGLLPDGAVPPINVLIVEDNVINLQLLEAFMKRLKVRWQSAMNGKEAVDKWRAGGFHLVLMDIQLPVMNGLDATKEIRRLERVNSIGAFSQSPSSPSREDAPAVPDEKDKLPNSILFKSPVIIVALTASSLQSDRHEALAAGCNDFLTKPVNFIWLERKVTEWGCMQALIDFDGWRKWKDFTKTENSGGNEGKGGKGFRSQRLLTGQKGSGGEPKRLEEKGSLIPPIG